VDELQTESTMKIEEISPSHFDRGGNVVPIERLAGKAMPWENNLPTSDTEKFYHALANFTRTLAFKPDDRLGFLTDKLLDPRVVSAISGLAMAQGIRPIVVQTHTTNMMEIPTT
jgi:hypothetical protein